MPKYIQLYFLLLTSLFSFSLQAEEPEKTDLNNLLSQFHERGITHCDEFITTNIQAPGNWKYFINKHAGGIDGPSTEVSLTQISGEVGSFKTDYSFIQTLKKCFMHKRGHITSYESCKNSVDPLIWEVDHELSGFDYKRYKNFKGRLLYSKEVEVAGTKICLLEYEYRSRGKHSLYVPIK